MVDIRDIRNNAHGSTASRIRLGGVMVADAGEAVRSEDLHVSGVPFYNGTLQTLEDFLLDSKDFVDEVMGMHPRPEGTVAPCGRSGIVSMRT